MLPQNTLEYYSFEDLYSSLTNLGYIGHNKIKTKERLVSYIKKLINKY
jgi:hypothetical protein